MGWGGSTPTNTTSTQITQYPEWMATSMQDNIRRANEIADGRDAAGYQGYSPEARIEGLNDLQTGAINQAGQMAGGWLPGLNAAADSTMASNQMAMSAAGGQPWQNWQANAAYAGPSAMVQGQNFLQANVGAYMNPFHQQVTQNTLGNIEGARQMQNMQNADSATKAKAFGGSRHGVVEGMTNQGFAKQSAETAANLNAQNFGQAQQQINADQNRNLQAQGMNQAGWNSMNQFNAGLGQQANMFNAQIGQDREAASRDMQLRAAGLVGQNAGSFANQANLWQSLGINDVNNMMTAGDRVQDQNQQFRDWAYGQWQGAQNHPLDNLAIRQGAVSGTPYQPGYSQTTPIFRNQTAGFLGGAAQGAQMGGQYGGGWGALLGGLAGGYMGYRG
jgi:hypothetical protein